MWCFIRTCWRTHQLVMQTVCPCRWHWPSWRPWQRSSMRRRGKLTKDVRSVTSRRPWTNATWTRCAHVSAWVVPGRCRHQLTDWLISEWVFWPDYEPYSRNLKSTFSQVLTRLRRAFLVHVHKHQLPSAYNYLPICSLVFSLLYRNICLQDGLYWQRSSVLQAFKWVIVRVVYYMDI